MRFVFVCFCSCGFSSFCFLSPFLFMRRRCCSFAFGASSGSCLISDIGVFCVSRVRCFFASTLFCLGRAVWVSQLLLTFSGCAFPYPSHWWNACVGFVGSGRTRPYLRIEFPFHIIDNKYGAIGAILLDLQGATRPRHSGLVTTLHAQPGAFGQVPQRSSLLWGGGGGDFHVSFLVFHISRRRLSWFGK